MSNRVNMLYVIKDVKVIFCNEVIYIEKKMFLLKIKNFLVIYILNIFVIFLLSRYFIRLIMI